MLNQMAATVRSGGCNGVAVRGMYTVAQMPVLVRCLQGASGHKRVKPVTLLVARGRVQGYVSVFTCNSICSVLCLLAFVCAL